MKKKILVVDDEMAILVAFRKLLTNFGADVDTADNIADAEKLIKAVDYFAVIADLRLTGVLGEEGLEIIKFVKEHNSETKCILLTGYGSPEVMNKAYELGAECYFEKPVPIADLKSALEELGL